MRLRQGRLIAAALAVLAVPPTASAGSVDADLAFARHNGLFSHIYVIRADGTGLRRVTPPRPRRSDAYGSSSPTWSPDGRRIAFASSGRAMREDAPSDVFVARPDGTGLRQITRTRDSADQPVWSPAGDRIAFVRSISSRRALRGAIYTVDPGGGALRRLTTGRYYDLSPTWSPDGARIAFVRITFTAEQLNTELYVMNADGSGQAKLADVVGSGVAWSPLGDRLLLADARDRFGQTCYHECRDSNELYTTAADGTAPVRITTTEADEAEPAWAPDGSAIAFRSDRSDPDAHDDELYLARPDGTCVTALTSNRPILTEGAPAWRPTADMSRARLNC